MTREEAIKTIENAKHFAYDGIYEEAFDMAIKALEQEPRKGHWISRWYAGHDLHFHVCSECNEEFSCDMETGISIDNYRYCPNCGCRMVDPQKSEDV